MEISKKINQIIISYQRNDINKDLAKLKLDDLLKQDLEFIRTGNKRFIKNKIHKIKKVL